MPQVMNAQPLQPSSPRPEARRAKGAAVGGGDGRGAVGGFIGAFFALPIAAIIQSFLATYSRRYDIIDVDLTHVDTPKPPMARPVQE